MIESIITLVMFFLISAATIFGVTMLTLLLLDILTDSPSGNFEDGAFGGFIKMIHHEIDKWI